MHTTFQYAGTDGKRHRLREGMVFFDPPEYYDAPGNCAIHYRSSQFSGTAFVLNLLASVKVEDCNIMSWHLLS